MRFRRSDPHTLAAAYAMDAVPRPDEARFERHLAGCDSCRQEVRGLREATAALASAAAVDPPAAFRDAALRAAAQTRQLPPADSASPARWAAFRGRPGWLGRLGRLGWRGWVGWVGSGLAGGRGWSSRWRAFWPRSRSRPG